MEYQSNNSNSVVITASNGTAHYRNSKGTDTLVVFEAGDWKREIAHNTGHFKAIVDEVLPKTLRERLSSFASSRPSKSSMST